MAKKRMKKITKRWLINSFGVVLVIVAGVGGAPPLLGHGHYYNRAPPFPPSSFPDASI